MVCYVDEYLIALADQEKRHHDRGMIVVTAWELAKGDPDRFTRYEIERVRLSRDFELKWGVPA